MDESVSVLNVTLLTQPGANTDLTLTMCPLLNISQCPASEMFGNNLTVNIYNPLGHQRSYYTRLPVILDSYLVVFS